MALTEKARRTKLIQSQYLRENADASPTPRNDGSLVLDRSHVISDLYYKRKRYKVYWGGRGAVKSWGAAEALVRRAMVSAVRVLCMREFQNSIADSSHKLLKDTIERLGVGSWFDITDKYIRSRAGAEFMFRGMHGKEQTLRSIEGVDILWIEEAQTFSAASWKSIVPTIRKKGSEIWVTYNLINENDATHKRFVNSDGSNAWPEEAIVHKVTYLDNPYFPGSELEKEMERDKEMDFDLYEHVWLGMA